MNTLKLEGEVREIINFLEEYRKELEVVEKQTANSIKFLEKYLEMLHEKSNINQVIAVTDTVQSVITTLKYDMNNFKK